MFEPHGYADQALANACGAALIFRKTAMRGGRRVSNSRLVSPKLAVLLHTGVLSMI